MYSWISSNQVSLVHGNLIVDCLSNLVSLSNLITGVQVNTRVSTAVSPYGNIKYDKQACVSMMTHYVFIIYLLIN